MVLSIPTTIYDADVNSGVPIDLNVFTFNVGKTVKLGINDVNEKSSSLSEEDLFPTNSWRGLMSGDITISGVIDRRLYNTNNIITKSLLDALVKSPNSKLIVNEVYGAKFYDIVSATYKAKKMGEEEIRTDVNTTVSSTQSSGSTTLSVNSSSGLVAGMIVKVYSSGSSGNYELLEISSINSSTITFTTKTILNHSAGASFIYDATQHAPIVTYTLKLTRCRNPSTY